MTDHEYIQDESETVDWIVYAEYVMWKMSQDPSGVSQPKIEDRRFSDSQRDSP